MSSKVANPVAPANVANDEDLLDISDTELIRASQVVESQLKFTNNVHHTTNNAMNIFSQFSQATNSQYHRDGDFNSHNHHNQGMSSSNYHHAGAASNRGVMGPPSSNYPSSSYSVNNTLISCTNPNYADMSDEEVRGEVMRLKSENMQKDGEVLFDLKLI